MDVIQIIVTIMVVTILVTITLAAAAYAAFRMRERRAPRPSVADAAVPVFFERVRFPALEESEAVEDRETGGFSTLTPAHSGAGISFAPSSAA